MTKTKWDKCGRNSEKAIKEIRRSANSQEVELKERQTGSHWVGKVPGRGSVVVPRNGEIPRGTWASIMRMLKAIGLAIFIGFIVYLNYGG